MRQGYIKMMMLLSLLIESCWICRAQSTTTFLIDDYHYCLYGTGAAICGVSNSCTDDSYLFPSTISYKGVEYTVTDVYINAFNSNNRVAKITLPDSMESIGYWAFANCQNLKEINLGGTHSIGFSAFENCKNLTSIVIPSTLTSFQDMPSESATFYGCNHLREIIYLPTQAPLNWTAAGMTYVPDKKSYVNPKWSMNSARIIEMISFKEDEFIYTGSAPNPTWTNNMEGYSASLSFSTLSGEVGNHEEWITVTFTKGNESFTANVVYRYTVKPAKLTGKVTNASREYGEENPQFSISYSGFVNGENESEITIQPTISTTATKTSDVGEYPINISGGSSTNYELVYEPGVLTITKAPLSAKVKDATKVYGTQNPAFTIEYNGLKNGESSPVWTTRPAFQTEATISSGVGLYEVKTDNGIPVNYDLGNIASGTLNISPAPLTIKANDVNKQYYEENPQLTYSFSGFVNGDDESKLSVKPEISTSAVQTSGVGTYEIKVSNAEDKNYSISNVSGTLTVTPRTLLASVGNYERYYNEENPTFEVKYDGFAGNEDESVLNSKAVANTQATKTSDVGTYPINITGGSADNYKFFYNSGMLTINKAEQTIKWVQDLSDLKTGDQIELKAEASSGLPITYTMNSNGAAEIYSAGSKQYLDCLANGQFIIRAVQEGNKNYYSSPRASNTVSIIGNATPSDPTLTIQQADNGSICTQVQKGSVYTFSITPSKSWKIHSVTFNDVDVTNQLYDGSTFTTPAITTNSILAVVYELDDIDEIRAINESNVTIQGTSYGARVIGANKGDMISICTTDGSLYHSVKAEQEVVDVPLRKDTVYIIKVGTKTIKLSH